MRWWVRGGGEREKQPVWTVSILLPRCKRDGRSSTLCSGWWEEEDEKGSFMATFLEPRWKAKKSLVRSSIQWVIGFLIHYLRNLECGSLQDLSTSISDLQSTVAFLSLATAAPILRPCPTVKIDDWHVALGELVSVNGKRLIKKKLTDKVELRTRGRDRISLLARDDIPLNGQMSVDSRLSWMCEWIQGMRLRLILTLT